MSKRAAYVTLLTLSLLAPSACLAPRPFDEKAWREQVAAQKPADLYAPHRAADGTFFNPWLPLDRSPWDLLAWFLSRNSLEGAEVQEPPPAATANDGAYLADPGQPSSLTWVGHATYVLQWGGQVVVSDPFFSQRSAIIKRLNQPAFGPERIPDGSVVVISHNHYDHLDADSVAALGSRVVFLAPLGLGQLLREMGATRVRELDWWQEVEIDGTRFTCLPAQHWSRRLGQGYNQSLWCGWLMERDGLKVFYGGDSGYFVGFKEIGRRWPGIEVALLGAGAYMPRWFMHYAHMDIDELIQAHRDLGSRRLIPTQWGTLKLGDEPADWPAVELSRRQAQDSALAREVLLLPVGGRVFLSPERAAER